MCVCVCVSMVVQEMYEYEQISSWFCMLNVSKYITRIQVGLICVLIDLTLNIPSSPVPINRDGNESSSSRVSNQNHKLIAKVDVAGGGYYGHKDLQGNVSIWTTSTCTRHMRSLTLPVNQLSI